MGVCYCSCLLVAVTYGPSASVCESQDVGSEVVQWCSKGSLPVTCMGQCIGCVHVPVLLKPAFIPTAVQYYSPYTTSAARCLMQESVVSLLLLRAVQHVALQPMLWSCRIAASATHCACVL